MGLPRCDRGQLICPDGWCCEEHTGPIDALPYESEMGVSLPPLPDEAYAPDAVALDGEGLCPTCDSSGSVEGPEQGWYELACPKCGGSGVLPAASEVSGTPGGENQ